MIFRLSRALNEKIGAGVLEAVPADDNPFADWSAHLFRFDRVQYIILCNTPSLYSCLTYGKGVGDSGALLRQGLVAIRDSLARDGHLPAYERWVAPSAENVRFAKALNRSVTGSMNDLVRLGKSYLAGGLSPGEAGHRLNEAPMSALVGADGRNYASPRAVFARIAGTAGTGG